MFLKKAVKASSFCFLFGSFLLCIAAGLTILSSIVAILGLGELMFPFQYLIALAFIGVGFYILGLLSIIAEGFRKKHPRSGRKTSN